MDVPGWVWGLTVVGIVGLLAFDFVFYVRRAARDYATSAAAHRSE